MSDPKTPTPSGASPSPEKKKPADAVPPEFRMSDSSSPSADAQHFPTGTGGAPAAPSSEAPAVSAPLPPALNPLFATKKRKKNRKPTAIAVVIVVLVMGVIFYNYVMHLAPPPAEKIIIQSKWTKDASLVTREVSDNLWKFYMPFGDFSSVALSDNDLWLGSVRGLWRYRLSEGKWQTFADFGNLPSSSALHLACYNDSLYVGTPKGLARFDLKDEKWFVEKPFHKKISQLPVGGLLQANGDLWCFSEGGHASRLNAKENLWEIVPRDEKELKTAGLDMQLSPTGVSREEWQKALSDFSKANEKFYQLRMKYHINEEASPRTTGLCLLKDELWFSVRYGFMRIQRATGKTTFVPVWLKAQNAMPENMRKPLERYFEWETLHHPVVVNGKIWFSMGNALFSFDTETGAAKFLYQEDGPGGRNVGPKLAEILPLPFAGMCVSGEDVFAGADNRRVRLTSKPGDSAVSAIQSLPAECGKLCVLEAGEKFIVAAGEHGVWLDPLRGQDKIVLAYPQRPPDNSFSNLLRVEQQVWLGSLKDGIYIYSIVDNSWRHLLTVDNVRIGSVTRLLRSEQTIWAATSSGLWAFSIPDLKARRFNKVSSGIISDNVLCMAIKEGEIWCGTDAGLCVYNVKNDDWLTIPTEHKTESGTGAGFEEIHVIGFAGKWVFLGGERGGIMYFDRHNRQNNPRMQYVFDAPPFFGFQVLSLAERNGVLWVGTTAGVFRVELSAPEAVEIKLVFQAVSLPDKTSGKQLGAVRGLCLKNGVDGMLCGSDLGLFIFGDDGAARFSVSPWDYYNFGSITDFDSGEEGLWCVIGSRLGLLEKVGQNAPAATLFKTVKN